MLKEPKKDHIQLHLNRDYCLQRSHSQIQEEFGHLDFEYVEAVSIDYPVSDRLIMSRGAGHSSTEGWVQLWPDGGEKRSCLPSNS